MVLPFFAICTRDGRGLPAADLGEHRHHALDELAHLLGREAGAGRGNHHVHAIGHHQMAAHLDRTHGPRPGRHRRGFAAQQFANALQRQAGGGPFLDLQQLLQVHCAVAGGAGLALRAVHQADLHVVAHRAGRQVHQHAQLGQRVAGAGGRGVGVHAPIKTLILSILNCLFVNFWRAYALL